jgi:hypothetical protein
MTPELHGELKALCWLYFLGEISEEEWALLQVHMAYCPDSQLTFRLNEAASHSRPERKHKQKQFVLSAGGSGGRTVSGYKISP